MERIIKDTLQNDLNFFSRTVEKKFDNFQKTKFIPTDPNLEEIKKILDKKPITEFALQKASELYEKVVDKEKFALPTLMDEKTNEIKDNPYISYIELLEGFILYKENLSIVKKLLKERGVTIFIRFFKTNDVTPQEAIEAYKLLDECGSFYVDLFYKSYPFLADTMDTALPVEFRKQSKTAFQKGFQEKEYDSKDPLKETRDNKKELFSNIEKELNKEVEGKPNALELLLAIIVEAGLETQELQEKLKNANFNPDKKTLLEQKYPSAFDITLLNTQKPENVEDGVEMGSKNRGIFRAGLNAVGLEAINQGVINIFFGKKGSLKDIDLTKFQSYGAGTLGGMEFVRDDKYTKEEYETWLQNKGIIKNEEDKKLLNKLDAGEIAFKTDLKDEKRKEEGRKNHLTAFANALPFASLNYLAGDMAVRSDEGVLKHLFFKMEWEALKKKEQEKNEVAQIDVLLQEASFNNLRIIFDNETYGIGKLSLKDIKIDAKQLIEKAGKMSDLGDLSDKLIPLFKNLSVLAVAVVQQMIGRFRGEPSLSESSKGLQQVLSEGFLEYTGLNLTTSDVIVENFYSTSMGRIGKIGLGATTMKMQGKSPSENIEPAFQEEKSHLKGLKKQYQELLEKRAKSRHEDAEFNKEIEKLYEQINTQEAKLLEKEGNTSFSFGLETNHFELREAELLQEMMAQMLKESFKESGVEMDGVQGLSDFELPQGLKLGNIFHQIAPQYQALQPLLDKNNTQISSEQVKNLSVNIPKIKFLNPVTASRLTYTGKEDLVDEKTNQPKKNREGKKEQKETMRVLGTDIAFTGLELGLKIDFADYDKAKPPREEDSLIKNMQINGLKAKKASFGTFQFQQVNPQEPIKKGTENQSNLYNLLDFKDKVTFHDFDFSFDQQAEQMGLKIGQIQQEYKNGLHFNYLDKATEKDAETGNEVEKKITAGGRFNIGHAGGLDYQKKGSEQHIKLDYLNLNENFLDKFEFKKGDLEIKSGQVSMNRIKLTGLDFKMDSQTGLMYLQKLECLEVPDLSFITPTEIIHQGKTYKLNKGGLSGLKAQNLELDFQGKNPFEIFKKGKISFDDFHLSDLALQGVGNINYFGLDKFSIEKIYDEKYEAISFKGKQSSRFSKSGVMFDQESHHLKLSEHSDVAFEYRKDKDNESPYVSGKFDDVETEIDLQSKNRKNFNIKIDQIGIKTDGKTFADLDFGNYISMPRIQYESKNGMYLKGFNESGLIRLEKPSAKLKFIKDEKEDKIKNIKIEQFHIDKIVASKLKFGQYHEVTEDDKKRDYEKGTGKYRNYAVGSIDKREGYESATFELKNGKTGSLTDVNLSGDFRLSDGAFALKGGAEKINLEELKAVFSQNILLNPYLQADHLTFSREYNGDINAEMDNFDLGLVQGKDPHNTQNPNHGTVEPDDMGMIYLEQLADNKNTPVLRAGKLIYDSKGNKKEVTLRNPKLGAIALQGHFHGYNGTWGSGIGLKKMIMQGEMKGDFKFIDTPKEMILDGKDFVFQIPEAHFIANSMSELFSLTNPKEKDQNNISEKKEEEKYNVLFEQLKKRQEKQKFNELPEYIKKHQPVTDRYIPEVENAKRLAEFHQQQLRIKQSKEENQKKLQYKSKEYEFLNLFGGSNLSVKAYDENILLDVKEYDESKKTYIEFFPFLKGLSAVSTRFFLEKYLTKNSTVGKLAQAEQRAIISVVQSRIESVFENKYGDVFKNNRIDLPIFAFFLEELAGDMQKVFIREVVSGVTHFLVSQGFTVVEIFSGNPLSPIMLHPLEDYAGDKATEYAQEYVDELLKPKPTDPNDNSLMPEFVEDMIKDMNLQISGNIKASASKNDATNRGVLKPYTQEIPEKKKSEVYNEENLVNNDFSLQSSFNLKFGKKVIGFEKQKGYRRPTPLELIKFEAEQMMKNTTFDTFGQNSFRRKQDYDKQFSTIRTVPIYEVYPTLSLKNSQFNGFSFPMSGGKGILSTQSMGIEELMIKKESLKKTGAVNLDAKNVYLKGLYMKIRKGDDANKQKKTGK